MADTICLLGDSVAKGIVCTEPGGRYAHSPCAFLRRICEEASLTLLDHARFGCTLSKAQALAGRLSSEFAGSRATLILLGGNDCDYDWSAIAAAPAADHACCTPLPVFESGYISLVSRIQKEADGLCSSAWFRCWAGGITAGSRRGTARPESGST